MSYDVQFRRRCGEMDNDQLVMNFYDNEYWPLKEQHISTKEIAKKFTKVKLLEIHSMAYSFDASKKTRVIILDNIARYVESIRRARSLKCW
jgi:hypothetical protein